MRKIRIIALILLCHGLSFAQNRAIDSLKKVIAEAKSDTIKLYSLNRLIEISPDVEWQKANEEMGQIAKTAIDLNKADKRILHVAKRFYAAYINNIGYDAFEKGNVSKAIESYHKCLKIYESINEIYDVALTYNNLGFMYSNENDQGQAMKYYQLSLKAYQKINHEWGIGLCYNNIGLYYFNKLKSFVGKREYTDSVDYYFNKALWYHAHAYALQEKGEDNYGFATSCNNLGTIYSLRGEHYLAVGLNKDSANYFIDKAMSYQSKGLALFTEFGNNGGIFDCKNNLGFSYFLKRDYKNALSYCKDALKLAREHNLPHKISLAAKHLYRIYKEQNDTKDALEMYILFIQMRDSVTNEKNKKTLIRKEFQYQYDKKATADSVKAAEEKKVTNAQLKQEQTVRYALFIGLFIVIVFLAFLYNRFKVTQKQKKIIQTQKHEVEEHRKDILDSIHYAKRIQNTLLAHQDFLNENLSNNFVLFKPKDIVSGDFYWATRQGDRFYIAVCDSTGHGVPGAFMSLLNINFLNEAINEKNIPDPDQIFNYVRERLICSIGKEGQQDGFDGILICMDSTKNKITYVAANNAPILVSGNSYVELEKDKMPVGKGGVDRSFKLQHLTVNKGDALYLYTDGYADQFGGPKGKKFKYKQLNELLLEISNKPLGMQTQVLSETLDAWKGNLEQVDDVCLIGIKF